MTGRTRVPKIPAAVAIVALLSWPASARAQPKDDAARADILFAVAKELRATGLYADACPKFAEVEQLAPAIGIMLHLADCYEHLGRPESAALEYRKAEALARERSDKRVAVARARAEALESKIKRTTIAVAKAPQLDGPGANPEIGASGDSAAADVTVASPANGASPAAIPAAADSGPAVTPSAQGSGSMPTAPPNAETPAPTMAHVTRASVEIGLLSGGVVGLGVGAALLAVKNQAITSGGDSSTAGTASAVAFAVGGAAILSSIVLYLTAPPDKGVAIGVSPMPLVAGGGAVFRGSF
jgi:hypothetical protein